jgi:hypothetical protein
MENWRVPTTDALPAIPEDKDVPGLVAAHGKLLRLRRDLDRARLIVDRVRRREKLKRELVRVAGDALEAHLSSLAVDDNEEVQEQPSKKDANQAKQQHDDANDGNNRGGRAAKAEAKEKLANTGSAHNLFIKTSIDPELDDEFDESVLPFTLDEVNYEQLEIPPTPSLSFGVGGFGRDHDGDKGSGRQGLAARNRFSAQLSPVGSAVVSGWTGDEDHLLLLGVAACGVGRWTEIREDFLLGRNSAQMNQRFTRLARRRCMLVKITGSSSAAAAKHASSSKGSSSKQQDDDSEEDDEGGEYTEVRTAFMSASDVQQARSKLPLILVKMLEKYDEDSVWESIALRHLFDTQSKEKRCGRPQKYPLPIPIPKHLQNGGWQTRKKNLVQRPSTLIPGWQPGSGGGYGVGVGTYQPPNQSSTQRGYIANTAPPRPRGRPRKKRSRYSRGNDSSDGDSDSDDEDDDDDDDESEEQEDQAVVAQRRKEEQDQLREERLRARALASTEDLTQLSKNTSSNSLASLGRKKEGAARCSLGSLSAPDREKRGSKAGSVSSDNGSGSATAGSKRGRRSPRSEKEVDGRRKRRI